MRPLILYFSAIALLVMTGTPAAVAQIATYIAGGTHQCSSTTGSGHTCVVSGVAFSTCIDATNSLRLQDCCPATETCDRDRTTGETKCRRGGKSVGFTLNYCITSGRF